MTWDGDISEMGQLAENIARLASVPSRAAQDVAQSLEELIAMQFAGEADPYGNAWQPHAEATVDRWGPHPILDLTGSMKDSVRVAPMRATGVSITIDHPAAPHQTGWSGPQGEGPARPVLPGDAFPPLWDEAISAAVDAAFEKVVA